MQTQNQLPHPYLPLCSLQLPAKVGKGHGGGFALLPPGAVCLGKMYLLLCLLHCRGTRVTELLLLSTFAFWSKNVRMIKLAVQAFAV